MARRLQRGTCSQGRKVASFSPPSPQLRKKARIPIIVIANYAVCLAAPLCGLLNRLSNYGIQLAYKNILAYPDTTCLTSSLSMLIMHTFSVLYTKCLSIGRPVHSLPMQCISCNSLHAFARRGNRLKSEDSSSLLSPLSSSLSVCLSARLSVCCLSPSIFLAPLYSPPSPPIRCPHHSIESAFTMACVPC